LQQAGEGRANGEEHQIQRVVATSARGRPLGAMSKWKSKMLKMMGARIASASGT
jgi:hypothetical protein